VKRRAFITLLGGTAATWPLAARAQQPAMPVVGFLSSRSPNESASAVAAFRQSLGEAGNITGVTLFTSLLVAKRLELLHELVPTATTIAILVNPNNSNAEPDTKVAQTAARSLGQQLVVLSASSESDIDAAFATLVRQRANALLVNTDAFFLTRRNQFVRLAARHSVPTIHDLREFTAAGGLVSYGTNLPAAYRQAGTYVGKILNGEQPANLPVIQPTEFDLVINLKTAKALGLEVPPTLLATADEVIE